MREVDLLARFGGDEFVILLESVMDIQEVTIVEKKLHEVMARSFLLDAQQVEVAVSIGIAMFPGEGTTKEELLAVADGAMYSKKRARQAENRVSQSKAIRSPSSQ